MVTAFQKILLFIATSITDILLVLFTRSQKQKLVLVVNLATIGDYILFRNFLENVKKEYREHKIILFGNIIWKELSEYFDDSYIDEFVWVDVHKFVNNLKYRFFIIKKARTYKYNTVLHPCYSRSFFQGDQIVKNVSAEEKIGIKCEKSKFYFLKKLTSDRYYTQLIETPEDNIFEFNRNKIFFEEFFQKKLGIYKPNLAPLSIENPVKEKQYIVVVPGAGAKFREWNPSKYAEVIKFLWDEFSYKTVLVGALRDIGLAIHILSKLDDADAVVINMVGKTGLLETCKIIDDSKLVISNETGVVHIAVALNKRVLCISNGNHLGRFSPYPLEVYDKAYYVFPPEISCRLHKFNEIKEKYRYNSNLDIDSISPDIVKTKIAAFLFT